MAAIPSLPVPTDTDAQETREWLDALSAVIQQEGPERAHYLIEKQIELARAAGVNVAYSANTAYVNTIPPDQEVRSPGRSRARKPHPFLRALERAGHGAARQQGRFQPRRPHRELRLGRDALRRRLQSLLARAHRTPRRRHGVRAGPFLARHLRACVHARAPDRRTDGPFPPRGRRQGACRRIRIRG